MQLHEAEERERKAALSEQRGSIDKREMMRQASLQMYRDELRKHIYQTQKKMASKQQNPTDSRKPAPPKNLVQYFQLQLPRIVGASIGAYFYKRKKEALIPKDKSKEKGIFAKVFSKI